MAAVATTSCAAPNDALAGDSGDDILDGGDSNDAITGGAGADVLSQSLLCRGHPEVEGIDAREWPAYFTLTTVPRTVPFGRSAIKAPSRLAIWTQFSVSVCLFQLLQ